jgi:hypothetical protein
MAILALGMTWQFHRSSGLPWSARFLADDRGSSAAPRRTLVSTTYGPVRGIPDGIVSVRTWRSAFRRVHVPLEVKPLHDAPRPSDLMQLTAYMVAMSEADPQYGGFGYLKTRAGVFVVRDRRALRRRFAAVVAARSAAAARGQEGLAPGRSHDDAQVCRRCQYVAVCDVALTAKRR